VEHKGTLVLLSDSKQAAWGWAAARDPLQRTLQPRMHAQLTPRRRRARGGNPGSGTWALCLCAAASTHPERDSMLNICGGLLGGCRGRRCHGERGVGFWGMPGQRELRAQLR
jgi:hypothetical protein